jgi:hypothetical protein
VLEPLGTTGVVRTKIGESERDGEFTAYRWWRVILEPKGKSWRGMCRVSVGAVWWRGEAPTRVGTRIIQDRRPGSRTGVTGFTTPGHEPNVSSGCSPHIDARSAFINTLGSVKVTRESAKRRSQIKIGGIITLPQIVHKYLE